MNILFFADNFPPERNAAATRVFERACYWIRWGHSVTVIASAPNFPEGKVYSGYKNRWYQVEEIEGIRVVRVKTFISPNEGFLLRTLDFLSYMVSGSAAALFQPKPDLVTATSPQFFAAVAGALVAALRRRPFVFELGDLWPASIAALGAIKASLPIRLLEKLELYLYRRSAAVISLTNAFKRDLVSRGIDPEKIQVVLNGVDMSRYSPRPEDQELAATLGLENRFVIGYIGTHGLAHALERALDAAELLRGDDRVRFLFVGAGAARQGLVQNAADRKLDNVVFVPAQPKQEMPRYWSLCDVALVHLKDSALFASVIPSKIFEAMGMGLPIMIAAPPGEATAIVEQEHCGIVLPAERPDLLADAVRRLDADRELLARLGRCSHDAAARFSREYQARRVIEVYDWVLRTSGAPLAAERTRSSSL